jgi:long-chain acyl-CoA synthetase
MTQSMVFSCGGRVAFYSGDLKLLVDDFSAALPTVFMAVPRVLQR